MALPTSNEDDKKLETATGSFSDSREADEQEPENEEDESGSIDPNEGKTTGDIQHEEALASRLDRQKTLDEQSKGEQAQSVREHGEDEQPKDKESENKGKGEAPTGGKIMQDQWARQNTMEKLRALQSGKAAEQAAEAQKGQQPQAPAAGNKGGGKVGMLQNVLRFKDKGFSCTGFVGTVYRLVLDYLGAFYIYVFLDKMIKEDNTDRLFTCQCCINLAIQIIIPLLPFIVGLTLLIAAGAVLNNFVDLGQVFDYIK